MKKFEITKEQILELSDNFGNDNKGGLRSNLTTKLKELFPDAFKKELEVGRWYKNNFNSLFYLTKIIDNKHFGYGFLEHGTYAECANWGAYGLTEATTQEVESALICEADKRGLLDGSYYLSPNGRHKRIVKYPLELSDDVLIDANKYFIFSSGQWATIIETISKEEAEKILNKRIV